MRHLTTGTTMLYEFVQLIKKLQKIGLLICITFSICELVLSCVFRIVLFTVPVAAHDKL